MYKNTHRIKAYIKNKPHIPQKNNFIKTKHFVKWLPKKYIYFNKPGRTMLQFNQFHQCHSIRRINTSELEMQLTVL